MFTGASQADAEKALADQNGSVVDAIASLTVVPSITGAKHIPPTPVVNHGHDAETLERIRLGRLMSDILSASPKNDLRGKASHYPVKEQQTEVVECTAPSVPASSASQSSPQIA
jgi:hypothetical protein